MHHYCERNGLEDALWPARFSPTVLALRRNPWNCTPAIGRRKGDAEKEEADMGKWGEVRMGKWDIPTASAAGLWRNTRRRPVWSRSENSWRVATDRGLSVEPTAAQRASWFRSSSTWRDVFAAAFKPRWFRRFVTWRALTRRTLLLV